MSQSSKFLWEDTTITNKLILVFLENPGLGDPINVGTNEYVKGAKYFYIRSYDYHWVYCYGIAAPFKVRNRCIKIYLFGTLIKREITFPTKINLYGL